MLKGSVVLKSLLNKMKVCGLERVTLKIVALECWLNRAFEMITLKGVF